MRRGLAILAISAGVFMSCNGGQNAEEVKKVDSLLVEMNSAKMMLSEMEPSVFQPIKDTIEFDIKFVQMEFQDTMPLETAIMVDTYHRTLKSIVKFEKTYKAQQTDVDYSVDQLGDMKKDLESGVLVKENFDEFYPAEEEAVMRLIESNSNLKIWYESIEKNFNERRTPVVGLMNDIKSKKGY